MTKAGEPIQNLGKPREVVDPQIDTSMAFLAWEAGTSAGLDMFKWEHTAFYPRAFKARVMAWYKLHNAVELHSNVAAQRAANKKSRRRRQ